MSFEWLKKIFSFQFFGMIVGSAPISTVFYIGYLPEWSRHWSAFSAVIFSLIVLYNSCGFDASYYDMSYVLFLEFLYGFLLANLMVPIFRKAYQFSKNDNIVVDAFLAQVLLLAMCVPAIVHINIHVLDAVAFLCKMFFTCNAFFTKFFITVLTLLSPYFILRFFDIMEFWPTNKMFLYSELSFNRIIAGLIPVIYAVIFIYVTAFLFFDLTLVEVINFYKVVFSRVCKHIVLVLALLRNTITVKNFYILCKKLGLVGLLDSYGLINMKHYDIKYLE